MIALVVSLFCSDSRHSFSLPIVSMLTHLFVPLFVYSGLDDILCRHLYNRSSGHYRRPTAATPTETPLLRVDDSTATRRNSTVHTTFTKRQESAWAVRRCDKRCYGHRRRHQARLTPSCVSVSACDVRVLTTK